MKRPAIAWLPAGGEGTASSRLRAYLPCRLLRRAGWPCEIFHASKAGNYDVVVFQKRYDEASLDLARSLRRQGTRVVFDLCDNHFHYDLDQPEAQARRSSLLEQMIREADLATVSTPSLGEVVRAHTGREARVVDDMMGGTPLTRVFRIWGRLARARPRPRMRLVWFGVAGMEHPPFGLVDLRRILPRLEAFGDETPVSLTVISNSRSLANDYLAGSRLSIDYIAWNRRKFPAHIASHDVAVIPVSMNPLTRCKSANRPVLSLSLGVPVVAEPIPSYEELSEFIFLSSWVEGLRSYARDSRLRDAHVARGIAFIRERYDTKRILNQWIGVLQAALSLGAPDRPRNIDPHPETGAAAQSRL